MTVDVSKIEKGDFLDLRAEVITVYPGNPPGIYVSFAGALSSSFRITVPSVIAAHHPRSIGVGDRVTRTGGPDGVVIALDGDEAWVMWAAGYRATCPLASLERLP